MLNPNEYGLANMMDDIAEVNKDTEKQRAYQNDFLDYMKGIVTRNGSAFMLGGSTGGENPSQRGVSSMHAREADRKYRRTKLNLYETVEEITDTVASSIKQSRQQKERVGNIQHQSLKDNYRGLSSKQGTRKQAGGSWAKRESA